jgi:hypothetical protein
MSTAVKVTVTPERIALRPGAAADVEVTIQNASQVVEHFATSVVGLPSRELYSCEPDVVKLRPKEVGTVRIRITIPERSGMIAGPYVLGVLVQSPYQKDVSRCEELYLELQPVPALTMTVLPEVASGGKVGEYGVNLVNEGNTPLAITVTGTDQENLVGFEINPRELRLEPGMAAGARISATCAPPWSGQEKRRALTLRAHAGEVVVERPVAFVQRPRVRGGLVKVGGLTAALALLGGATIGGAMLIRDAKQDNQSPPTNAANQSQQPPVTPTAGVPPTQQQPSQPPSQQQSSTAQTPSSQPPSTGNGQTTGGDPGQTAKFIDFAKDVEETGEKLIASDRYQPEGIILATSTQRAPRGCEDANAQALRISRDRGLGGFLTTSKPTSATACLNMPLQFVFVQPATKVNLGFTGLGAEYRMIVQYSDGHNDERVAKSTTPGEVIILSYEAQSNQTIKAVTFWHANPDPNATDFTLVKSIGWTPK